ncbi:MAG: DUF58 domain-containing protein [Blastochloris sp.]|nr:DUF58 domain-containing protein [Blastochloris sp.]
MPVPTPRLLLLALLLGLPLATFSTLLPFLTLPCLAMLGLLGVLILFDALKSRDLFSGLSIHLPTLNRLAQDIPHDLPITLLNQNPHPAQLQLALDWPETFSTTQTSLLLHLPPNGTTTQVIWSFTAHQRGRYFVENFHLQRHSAWGFWSLTSTLPVQSEFRVYPSLQPERMELRSLLTQQYSHGLRPRRLMGQGREFEKLREYTPGDSFDSIHWKATARRRHPITRVYQIERTQEIYVLLDCSRLTQRTIQSPTLNRSEPLLEKLIRSSLLLGLAAAQQGDRYGLLLFHQQIEKFIRASSGRHHHNVLREALYEAKPHLVNPDYEEMAVCVQSHLTKRSLLILLTSLDDPVQSESLLRSLRVLSQKHLILVGLLQSPGIHPLFHGNPVQSLNDVYLHLAGHLLWHDLAQREQSLRHLGIRTLSVEPATMTRRLIDQYQQIKQRQLL